MNRKWTPHNNFKYSFLLLILLLIGFPNLAKAAEIQDKGSRGYWLAKYGEIKPESSSFSRRTHHVFRKVLKASNRRKGVEPELVIINYRGRPWAQSLADGTVVLTKNALEFSYKDVAVETGDSRIAFVIGHELAHQFNEDFWHYSFFQANVSEEMEKTKAFGEIKEIVKDYENFLVKELKADQYGVIYASIAGYDVDTIVSKDRNLFERWAKAMDPSGYLKTTASHPSPAQRTTAIITRLQDVTRRMALFKVGVIAYHVGLHKESIAIMEEFAKFYPSKEVYNNIGTAYMAMAYENYKHWKGMESIPFMFSFAYAPSTQAESIEVGRMDYESKDGYLQTYLFAANRAEEYLKRAVESGYKYAKAKNNLGCLYIMEERYYEALGVLEDALAYDPKKTNIEILNNRGIAHYYIAESLQVEKLKNKAAADFKKALSLDSGFEAASHNISIMKGNTHDAITSLHVNVPSAYTEENDDFPTMSNISLARKIELGQPVPSDIKATVKKGRLHEIVKDGKNRIAIYNLPEKDLTILEKNGRVEIIMVKGEKNLKPFINFLTDKAASPTRQFYYANKNIRLFSFKGFGLESVNEKISMGFFYTH